MSPFTYAFILLSVIIYGIVAPPVTKTEKKEVEHEKDGLENYMEYHRYLREVVNALESDTEFKKKLEQANEDDIRTGKIAHELQFVNHHVRTQLDEIKRRELERLKELMQKKKELMDNNEVDEDPVHHHVDHDNPHTFEIDDLKKLIKKTTEDLAEADRKRREEFKQYELQKEYEKQQKLNQTTPEEREKIERELKQMEEKHKKHEKLHEPGHKQQLEEVWEEQDHMQQDFDPKTFFMLHDLDGNGLWDETEVKALFIKELDKMYAAGAPEDDMRERAEEMERMREAVFQEVDTNRDGFIDFNEFMAQTKRNDFQQDHGWQGLDEQRQFTEEEYNEYVRQHNAGYQQVPPGYNQHMPPPVQGYHPQGGHPSQGGYQAPHPGQQMPPGYQVPPGAYQVPPGNFHPNAVPPQHFNGQPQQQFNGQPQQQFNGQPQQQFNGQPQQFQPNQQYHPQQVMQQQKRDQGVPPLNTNEVHPSQVQAQNVQYQQSGPQVKVENQQAYQQVNVQHEQNVQQQQQQPDFPQQQFNAEVNKNNEEAVLKPKQHNQNENKDQLQQN